MKKRTLHSHVKRSYHSRTQTKLDQEKNLGQNLLGHSKKASVHSLPHPTQKALSTCCRSHMKELTTAMVKGAHVPTSFVLAHNQRNSHNSPSNAIEVWEN